MNKLKIIATISSLMAVTSLVLNLGLTNTVAVDGFSLSYLESELQQEQQTNQNLNNQLAEQTSLSRLNQWASTQGFVPASNLTYLTTTTQVALVSNN